MQAGQVLRGGDELRGVASRELVALPARLVDCERELAAARKRERARGARVPLARVSRLLGISRDQALRLGQRGMLDLAELRAVETAARA